MKKILIGLLLLGSISSFAGSVGPGVLSCNFSNGWQVIVMANQNHTGTAIALQDNSVMGTFEITSGGNGDTFATADGVNFEFVVDAEDAHTGKIKAKLSNGQILDIKSSEMGCSMITKEWPF